MVTEWEQRAKGSAEWAAAANLVVLGHALLVSVKLLRTLQAAASEHQRQAGILALDIAHRLNGALSSASTASAPARTGALELGRLSMQLLGASGDGVHGEENRDLALQLTQLQLSSS
jgi:hypothetical protein